MKEKLVSIIVPMYNSEKYLDKCIESILNQDYKNIELILVNDGSIDNTEKIARSYAKKDKRVIVINQENMGVSEARNNGINHSFGEYITFIDSDDFIDSDFISYYVKLIEKNNVDVVLSRMPIKYRDDMIIPAQKVEKIEIIDGRECALEMLYYKIFISSWNKLFRKDLLINNNIFFEKNLSFGEGFNFSVDAFMKAKKVCITSICKYYYRVDNIESVMTKYSDKQISGSLYSIDRLRQKYEDIDIDILKALNYADWHTNFDCLNSIIGTRNTKQNYKRYKNIKKKVRKNSKYAFTAPISKKEKIKAVMCMICPYFASKIVNRFRIRKFNSNL